jgi:hypothetical protein
MLNDKSPEITPPMQMKFYILCQYFPNPHPCTLPFVATLQLGFCEHHWYILHISKVMRYCSFSAHQHHSLGREKGRG